MRLTSQSFIFNTAYIFEPWSIQYIQYIQYIIDSIIYCIVILFDQAHLT